MTEPDGTESTDVESLIADLEERVLAVTRGVFTWAALPALIGYHAIEWMHGDPTLWIAADVLAMAICVATLWAPVSRRVRTSVLLTQQLVLCGTTFLHFGPTMGAGLFFLGATLCASVLKGERVTALVVLGLIALIVAAALGQQLGLVHPVSFSPRPAEWPRLAVASILTILACAFVFIVVTRSLRASLTAEIRARRREQEAQSDRERVLVSAEKHQRLEALGRLAGGVAHDFNNALMVIRGGVELVGMARDDATRKALLQEIDAGVERATATARQLMAFARRSPDDEATTNPAERIEHMARSVARFLPANVRIDVKPSSTSEIALSPGAFDQIVLNLVLNARDAMRGGGTIVLRSRQERDEVVVEVEDGGEGMLPEVRARLFEPFFTTKGEEGTGLGLAMVWGLVTRASGTVEVDSNPGEGSCFRLRFPAVARVEARAADRAPLLSHRGRVLVLDDEPDVLRVLVRLLQRTGLEVDPVSSVTDALSHVEAGNHRLLMTDGIVPSGNVSLLIDRFRARNPAAPVIVCSGHLEDSVLLEEIARKDVRFLHKPFPADQLFAMVDQALGPEG